MKRGATLGQFCVPMRALILLSLLTTFALGQADTGSVSGHIYLADTQQPARFARVVLVPLPPALTSAPSSKPALQSYPSETLIDGSFSAARISPGDYFVSVTYPGYLSPEYEFSADDLLHPTQDIRKRIVETIPTVSVAANKAATISVSVHRGAAISGTLRYDDGSAVPDVEVIPLRRSLSGQWAEITRASSDNNLFEDAGTDDLGHFRIHGLASGEYTLKISRDAEYQKALTVYYGDVFFEKAAKSIHLGDGEESSGADITIRLSKLHSISGALINVSGQPINSGRIALFTVPGNIEIASAYVHEDSATFHMDLVPEGTYTLHVTEARDVNRQIVRDDKDPNQIQSIKETVLQLYGDYEASLDVLSDVPNLTLTIPSKH
jgi:hypothetical protein